MNKALIFPTIIITLSLTAALVYAVNQDWKHCVYWVAGAALNACMTYW